MSLLKIDNLHTYFQTNNSLIKAVNGISFNLFKGKCLGIVGESGSGKSQTALSILKLFTANQKIYQGQIVFNDQIISEFSEIQMQAIRGKDIAMIFQDPTMYLNPSLKIKNQIIEVLMTHENITSSEAVTKTFKMLEKVQIVNPLRVMELYPYQLSGGMCQRIMIAMALVCQPQLLISDEATTALDVIIQQEILILMRELQQEHQTAILFISHDLGTVSQMVDDVIVMYKGKIVEQAPLTLLLKNPLHPYTRSLLSNFLKTSLEQSSYSSFSDFFSSENKVFDFVNFKKSFSVDPDFWEAEPEHFVACRIKNKK